jgi:hypothetical protein
VRISAKAGTKTLQQSTARMAIIGGPHSPYCSDLVRCLATVNSRQLSAQHAISCSGKLQDGTWRLSRRVQHLGGDKPRKVAGPICATSRCRPEGR